MTPPATTSQHTSPQISVGPEIANAWGWLLSRAPRIAKILEATPGAAGMFASVLAGWDLLARQKGLTAEQFGRRFEPEVTINVHDRKIVIHMREN